LQGLEEKIEEEIGVMGGYTETKRRKISSRPFCKKGLSPIFFQKEG